MIKCPYCKEDLVVRCYWESFHDLEAIVTNDSLDVDTSCIMDRFRGEVDEYVDYECANCHENITKLIGMDVDDLKKKYPNSFK